MRGISVTLLIALLAACGLAQNDAAYRLKPEDRIRIQVYNESQIDAVLPVGRDGNVSAPFVGLIRAEGKTTSELEAELARLYVERLRLRDPKVAVTIMQYRVLRATVGGMVNRPGTYEIRPGDTLITLLNAAGGPVFDRANLKRATLRRAMTREQIPVDLRALINGDTSQNYEIEDGDELLVPEDVENHILILGAVAGPGLFPYREGMTLNDAIALGRGEIRTRSKLSEVLIIRRAPGDPNRILRIRANYVRFVRNGDYTQNVLLQPRDMIYVPETRTPDITQISAFVNTAFFIDRILRDGFFGIRPFSP